MKNRPLYVQIWILFIGVTLGISILMMAILPSTLRLFFSREMYLTIEEAQNVIMTKNWNGKLENPVELNQQRQDLRTVRHIVIFPNGRSFPSTSLLNPYISYFLNQASQQTKTFAQYSHKVEDKTIFYVIRKGNIAGRNVYLLSYMWSDYQQKLVRTLFIKILTVNLIVLLLSWIPAMWLAKKLSKPLVYMEKHVKQIATRDWHEPLVLERKDEIGRLAKSIEWMRNRLVYQDESQQSFLQHISHELKTPVMVIRSYAQSVQDGIYPKGDLQGTMKVIEEESERLDKRIRDLLYLTKLDYLATQNPIREALDLTSLTLDVVERLRYRRPQLQWQVEGSAAVVQGDREQWVIALENLLDNQIRYASNRIVIQLQIENTGVISNVLLHIWNDGPPIKNMELLFERFHKDDKGQFGLGLAIVERVVKLHGAEIWAANENNGASFYVRIPGRQTS